MKANIWKEIKNKMFICIKTNEECFKLVKDNKNIMLRLHFYSVKFISARRIKKLSQKLKHLIYLLAKIL